MVGALRNYGATTSSLNFYKLPVHVKYKCPIFNYDIFSHIQYNLQQIISP